MNVTYLFEHLDELLLLAEIQNYSEAADALYISQSSLSKHIQIMEKELGAPLFDRTTRRVVLNEFGRQMLPYLKKLGVARDELEQSAYRYRLQKSKQLVINIIPLLDAYQFSSLIACFQKTYPEYTVNIIENYETSPIDELRNGECDLALFRDCSVDASDLERVPYNEDHIVAVLSTNHDYAKAQFLELSSLRNDNFMLINPKTSIYRLCIDACKAEGFDPNVIFTSHKIESIVNMVEQNIGVALLTKQQAMLVERPTISIVELYPELKTGIFLYSRPGHTSEVATKFLDFIRAHANESIPQAEE